MSSLNYSAIARDFIFVQDVVNGIEAALRVNIQGCNTFHLANNKPTKVTEIAQTIATAMGIDFYQCEQLPSRVGEVKTTFATSDLATKILDFHCQVPIEEGIRKTINWLESNWSKDDFEKFLYFTISENCSLFYLKAGLLNFSNLENIVHQGISEA